MSGCSPLAGSRPATTSSSCWAGWEPVHLLPFLLLGRLGPTRLVPGRLQHPSFSACTNNKMYVSFCVFLHRMFKADKSERHSGTTPRFFASSLCFVRLRLVARRSFSRWLNSMLDAQGPLCGSALQTATRLARRPEQKLESSRVKNIRKKERSSARLSQTPKVSLCTRPAGPLFGSALQTATRLTRRQEQRS